MWFGHAESLSHPTRIPPGSWILAPHSFNFPLNLLQSCGTLVA